MSKTLVVLAAGMGSRFGGLKQMTPVGPNGEFIIDYSIYDAYKAGFDKVVFIIKEQNYEDFKNTVGNRVSKFIDVDYAFQGMSDFVDEYNTERTKPWGTGQAVLCAMDKIDDKFTIINADDYYGPESFKLASIYMDMAKPKEYAMIAYELDKTLSDKGTVKRGVCQSKDGYLTGIRESEILRQEKDLALARDLDTGELYLVERNVPASMQMIVMEKNLESILKREFKKFLEEFSDSLDKEFLLPTALSNGIRNRDFKMKMVMTPEVWFGMTYKDDLQNVKDKIKEKVDQGLYPEDLWTKDDKRTK